MFSLVSTNASKVHILMPLTGILLKKQNAWIFWAKALSTGGKWPIIELGKWDNPEIELVNRKRSEIVSDANTKDAFMSKEKTNARNLSSVNSSDLDYIFWNTGSYLEHYVIE